jgi:hypothetical protein
MCRIAVMESRIPRPARRHEPAPPAAEAPPACLVASLVLAGVLALSAAPVAAQETPPEQGEHRAPPVPVAPPVPDAAEGDSIRPAGAEPTPAPPAARRHARGGGPLAPIFGDSADYTLHNMVNLTVLGGATMGVLVLLPEGRTRWYRDRSKLSNFVSSYRRPPTFDNDYFFWNFIGHPWVGKQTYLMERNWGSSQLRSFAFAAAASVAWEYGFEAWMEHPSLTDLLVTAPAGWLLGEGVHRLTQRMARDGFSTPQKVVVTLLNPFYVLQHGYR